MYTSQEDKTKKFKQIFNVSNVSPDGIKLNPNDQRVVLQKNNERWHTDSSYRYIPSYLSFLYGLAMCHIFPTELLTVIFGQIDSKLQLSIS